MKEVLENLGYSRSESLVYLTLIKLGPSTAGKISRVSGISRVAVYEALHSLMKDGLVSFVLQTKKRIFKPAHPSKIKELLKEKKKQVENDVSKILNMIEIYNTKEENIEANIYQGIKGLHTLFEEFLNECKEGGEWLVFGVHKRAELLGGFFTDLSRRRGKKNIRLKVLFNKDAEGLIKIRKKQPLSEIRIMPDNYSTPASVDIIHNRVAITLYTSPIISFSVKNKDIADSFKQYFNLLWKIAKR